MNSYKCDIDREVLIEDVRSYNIPFLPKNLSKLALCGHRLGSDVSGVIPTA